MSIRILPSHISDQIAAGEVVERPASVVKELVENALDAGATQIEVLIEEGGKKLIEVRDNGIGMSPDDAMKYVLRHATSKIETIDDLFQIQTFGFRGEALAAISAISRFTLVTKTMNAREGTRIEIQAGAKPVISNAPANEGTTVRVENLFYPTPARRQFLKTDATEERSILREVQNFGLARPDVNFKLVKDEKLWLDLPAVANEANRIPQILKMGESELMAIQGELNGILLSGFISRPGTCQRTRKNQFLFVNGRAIEDGKISFAVREAFVQSAGIERHLHPVFVLFLKIDPILVDVNVHPRKREVKFAEPAEIFALVKKTVVKALQEAAHYNVTHYNMLSSPPLARRGGQRGCSQFSKKRSPPLFPKHKSI